MTQPPSISTRRSTTARRSIRGARNAARSPAPQKHPATGSIYGQPVAVVRCLRDMMVLESGDGLNLALGTERHWLASGKPVGIAAAPTHFGQITYQMQYNPAKSQVTGEAVFTDNSPAAWSTLHIRLPGGLKVKSVNPESKAVVLPDGSGIRWTAPRGTLKFQATVGG